MRWSSTVISILFVLATAETVSAEEPEAQWPIERLEASFPDCRGALMDEALRQGVPEAVIAEGLAPVRFQRRVIELDRAQPEFRQSFAAYLRARVSSTRINTGRLMLASYPELWSKLLADYGIPGRYLVAFWGLETNYGGFLGSMPTLDVLATLACDRRRSDFFTAQLMTALGLVAEQGLVPDDMRGSWAGAMGHTQFMPTTWRDHAIDGDNDGRIDLWNSIPDALASAANYLAALGWREGERWGREVRLPDDFPYAETGLAQRRSLSEWRELGVRTANGSPLPVADLEAAVLVPMGHRGPAFLVYPNFETIMAWNRSQSYALAIGHLADRLVGGGPLVAALPDVDRALARETILALQYRLIDLGHDPGEPDGLMGPATRAALRDWQSAAGRIADGYPDEDSLRAIGLSRTEGP